MYFLPPWLQYPVTRRFKPIEQLFPPPGSLDFESFSLEPDAVAASAADVEAILKVPGFQKSLY